MICDFVQNVCICWCTRVILNLFSSLGEAEREPLNVIVYFIVSCELNLDREPFRISSCYFDILSSLYSSLGIVNKLRA